MTPQQTLAHLIALLDAEDPRIVVAAATLILDAAGYEKRATR